MGYYNYTRGHHICHPLPVCVTGTSSILDDSPCCQQRRKGPGLVQEQDSTEVEDPCGLCGVSGCMCGAGEAGTGRPIRGRGENSSWRIQLGKDLR